MIKSQRAMVAGRLAKMPIGANQHSQGLPIGRASEMLNVGGRSVARPKEVQEAGAPELIAAVEHGVVSVSAAADVATLPKPEQAEALLAKERMLAGKKLHDDPMEIVPQGSESAPKEGPVSPHSKARARKQGAPELVAAVETGKVSVSAASVIAKHEAFAQALAKGKTADQAYTEAGYRPNRFNASRLKTNENILARVKEIVSKVSEKAEWTAADRLIGLKSIYDASVEDKDRRLTPVNKCKHLEAGRG